MAKTQIITPEAPRSKEWYVLRVYTSQEKIVKNYIDGEVKRLGMQDRVGEVLIPSETVVEMHDGRKRQRTRNFFPGYILIEMILDEKTRHLIDSAPSTLGFPGNPQNPQPLRQDEVDRILGRVAEKTERIVVEIPFQIDDKVKIIDGPFKDFIGSIKDINNEKRKLKVLVSIFGRSTPVEVDFLQVTTNIAQ